jgi:hypothetical protein
MLNRYSRLQSLEEKRNVKRAVFFIVLSILVIAVFFFYGIHALSRLLYFVSDLKKSNTPIQITDNTPPPPPRFNSFSNFTNQQNINLSGNGEPGSTIKLTLNGQEHSTLTDKDGNFSFSNLPLNSGVNTFSAISIDSAGNQSQKTQDYTITFDNKPPNLTITSPADGSQFNGSSQRQVTISGTTDAGAQVTINGRIVAVDDSGNFQYTTTLNDGANTFAAIATDQAGNTTEKDFTLNFSP